MQFPCRVTLPWKLHYLCPFFNAMQKNESFYKNEPSILLICPLKLQNGFML